MEEAIKNGKDGQPAMTVKDGRTIFDSAIYKQREKFNGQIMFGFSQIEPQA